MEFSITGGGGLPHFIPLLMIFLMFVMFKK